MMKLMYMKFSNTLEWEMDCYFMYDRIFIIRRFNSNKTHETTYESRIDYKIDNLPPFYDEEKGLRDFQFMFYSENYF